MTVRGPLFKIDALTIGCLGRVYLGFSVRWRWFGVHILPRYRQETFRRWGFEAGWYDGPLYSFGLGPIAMFVWQA